MKFRAYALEIQHGYVIWSKRRHQSEFSAAYYFQAKFKILQNI